MLKKIRKHLRQKRAAAAMALALALAYPAATVYADTGKQSFNDGQAHTLTDNITVTDDHGLETWNPGTSATMTGKTITVSGASPGYAAVAINGSKITLTDVAITGSGWGIAVIPAIATNSEISMTGGSLTTTDAMGIGVYANGGGMIALRNVAVRTMGSGSHGVVSDSVLPASNVVMTGGSITTEGTDSHGVYASHSGAITLTDVAVRTTGSMFSNGAYGIYADYSGRVTMTGGSITTTGNGNHGASAVDTASVELTNVTVRTEGAGSHGLGAAYYVFSPTIVPGGTIRMTGGSITTTGMGSYGAHAAHGGKVFLTNADVSTAGIGSWGLYAVDAGSKITMDGGRITTTGLGGNGVYCVTGGAAVLTNTAISTTGLGGAALYTDSGGTITASVNGQNLYSAGSLAISAGGEITITADGASRLSGDVVSLGGTINITLQGASTLTGTAGVVGGGTVNLTVSGNAAWTTATESNLSKLTLNGGTVVLARPAALPLLLRVLGPLEGAGGTFRTSVNINDVAQSDRVVVQGVVSGSHRFEVAVVGGYPTDLYRVVRLVELNNALVNTATFGGGSDVGPYRYGVAKGTALSSAYNGLFGGGEEDYYLYNTFGPSTPANAAIGTALGSSTMWYGEVNEIRKRLGDLRAGAASGDGLWARTYGGEYDIKPGEGQGFGQRVFGLEVGNDAPCKYAGGVRHTGWVAGSGWANRSFDMGGHGNTNSLYVGGYASWLKDDGAYWDIVAKQNWFRHSFDVPRLGNGNDSAVYGTTGFGLSVETGKRFEKGDGAFFEPQAELAALWTKGKSYTTAAGLAVNARAETSLQLRIGAVFGRKTATAEGGTRQVYGKLAWIEELAGEGRTTVDGVAFASSLKGGRLVAGAGLTLDTAKSQLFFDVERAWGTRTEMKWGINLGCRWKF